MSKEKVRYSTKKDAQSKLNYLQREVNTKSRPVRVYEDSNGWHLTKLHLIDNISLIDLLTSAIKYSESKRYGQGGVYKREWDDEKIIRNTIRKQLKMLNIC